ncbi:MAG: single-stranded DNA-binding protein [Deltaproteobacteria bacterium]|nr:single-stranded DNA-binding protein [Deltaproteobacteria bacterium]
MTSAIPSHTDLNLVVLAGKVANQPQFHYQPDGTPVLQFPLELNDSGVASGKTPLESGRGHALKRTGSRPSLINIVALGQLAQCRSTLQSGQRLIVKGQLNQRRWQTVEGRSRTRTEVIASELQSVEENKTDLKDRL